MQNVLCEYFMLLIHAKATAIDKPFYAGDNHILYFTYSINRRTHHVSYIDR